MVILWSDYFVYLLIGLALGACSLLRMLHINWHVLLCRPLNIIALWVLVIYGIIGLLDSIHFKNKHFSTISVLDQMLSPIAFYKEKTYSAPFAMYSFIQETQLQDKEWVRAYSRLQYAGTHLSSDQEKKSDLMQRFIHIGLKTLILSSALIIVLLVSGALYYRASWQEWFKKVIKGRTLFPWRTLMSMLVGTIFLITTVHDLMPHYHILGTNQIGEDVLYQALKSVRTGLIIGTLSTLIMLPFAIVFGTISGYFRGWIDDIIQYIYTTLNAIPAVLLIAASLLMLQVFIDKAAWQTLAQRADMRLLTLCAILGLTNWTTLCRLLRGETLKWRQMDFVQAAHLLGTSHLKTIVIHILPNLLPIILISVVLDFSALILAEAVLSYVGVGLDPSTYSWGMMINSARLEMARVPMVWWNLSAAFILMFVLVWSANIFSDALNEALGG